ncbi:threonine dehydratase biosynthetic, chloroplastic-like [Olea europaea subsp. europaea]|uniref:threonine ammonia-lyase n=1 Tax=Olea europaea subsp. europaea TaxID=158383 RepID=A0A8S0QSL1_OLEEU|nr:threonine dehydratase biosynthetic, chloroplastic-like [Olea europaea subsp. europaea]
MEVLRFVPAQMPLLRSKFTANDTVKSSSPAVRVKPLINAAAAKQEAEILPAVEREPLRVPSALPLLSVSPSSLQCETGYLIPNNPDNGGASNAGSHAQGVALSAQRLGCNAVIAMPVTTPEIKWRSVERLGATVVLVGDSYDEAHIYAKKRAEEENRTFIPPFDHPDVIIGQGTVGMEIIRQMKGPLHAIFVPVGDGGLIDGIAAYVKRVSLEVKILEWNHLMLMQWHYTCTMDMFEGLALAGAEAYCKYSGLKDENVVAVISGANMNFDRLRLVTELADVGRQREAVFATYMPKEPGSFKRFCEFVGPMNITEFKCQYNSDKEEALVLNGGKDEISLAINLTENDLVKDHLRHLQGRTIAFALLFYLLKGSGRFTIEISYLEITWLPTKNARGS